MIFRIGSRRFRIEGLFIFRKTPYPVQYEASIKLHLFMRYQLIKFPAIFFVLISVIIFVLFSVFAQADELWTSPIAATPTPGHIWEPQTPFAGTSRSVNELLDIASDTCTGASELELDYDGLIVAAVGDQTKDIGSYTTSFNSPVDPSISCLAGSSRPQGYRSAWYWVEAPVGGTMTVKTVTDQDYKRNYDTVIAIYSDSSGSACTGLTLLACNDDYDAFLSQASFQAVQGQIYRIEVVDRNIAASGPIHLNIEVSMEPDAGWQNEAEGMPERVSRHALVMDGVNAYIIAGQNVLVPDVKRVGQMWRYNTSTGVWTALANMPANESADGRGYSATDAALVNNQIHLISGYVGSIDSYAGDHWVYDIASDSWSIVTSPALNWNTGGLQGPVGYGELTEFTYTGLEGFYLTGGLAGQPLSDDPTQVRASAEVRRYVDNNGAKSWTTEPDMQVSRYGHTAVTIGATTCVAGGLTNSGVITGTNQIVELVECYDQFGGGSWFTIEPMNTSRFYAGSAVGPDGIWYVYGGRNSAQNYVETVEAIDISVAGATWQTLDVSFNIDNPPFSWLRGDFTGSQLFLFGGDIPNDLPTGVVQSHDFSNVQLTQPAVTFTVTNQVFLPVASSSQPLPAVTSPTGTREINPGDLIYENFDGAGDAYDIYQYNPTTAVDVIFDLLIPGTADYDLLLYDGDKNLILVGNNLGAQGEWIKGPLAAGRYYVIVARVSPPPSLPPSASDYELRLDYR
ncbi:MAG: hypothetical protein ACI9EW_001227 [Cellvibrionaceae bacterium]